MLQGGVTDMKVDSHYEGFITFFFIFGGIPLFLQFERMMDIVLQ
jgi:hypothetical protein